MAKQLIKQPQIDWSQFALNMKNAVNTSAFTPVNGSNVNGASAGCAITFTVAGTAYALVTVSVATISTTDFENKPLIYLDGTNVAGSQNSAAAGNSSSRSNQRMWQTVVTLTTGAHTISGGIFVSSATSPNVPVGNAQISAIVLGTVTA